MNILKLSLLSTLIVLLNINSFGQAAGQEYKASMNGWEVNLETAQAISVKTGKPILANFTGTDWCGWCKVMDRNTFTNPDVIDHINNNFIPVKFDAEYQNSVVFNNNSYNFVKSGRKGINELAYYLTNGNLSYPMTVFLDENYNLITLLPGYHKPNFYNLVFE